MKHICPNCNICCKQCVKVNDIVRILLLGVRTWSVIVTDLYLQASIPLTPGKWFYVTATFSQTSGLALFEDDKLVSKDSHGTPGEQFPIYDKQPNFCIGRNVGTAGTVFARFYMASFASFKEQLSPELVGKVYSYFWRQGKLKRAPYS